MNTPSGRTVRELDRRTADGIEVTLVWDPQSDQVSVVVRNTRHGALFELDVDGADALAAFHHPFAYAAYSQQPPARHMSSTTN